MSSGSESDEDYVPGAPEQVSEEGSADEETESQYEKEHEYKTNKRKSIQESKGKKKRRTRNGVKEVNIEPEKEDEQPAEVANPQEEKKREEDLWAKFLEGTDTQPKNTVKVESIINQTIKSAIDSTREKPAAMLASGSKDDSKEREKRIFEFAGETIVVENDVIKEKLKAGDISATGNKLESSSSRGRPAGLSGVLGQLNKKNQLSTLEKSKLDWMTYKKDEGIEEEIQSHNKGKSGYLDRQDFLERADLRQYELERDLRMNKRSNR